MANKILHTKALVLRENISVEEGVIDAVVGSTSVIDRMGDIIDQAGWDLKNFLKNPVILWGHNVKEERPPIGKAVKVWLEGKQERSKKLLFKVKFDLEDSFAAEIFRKVKDGFINTVSVGFMPTEWEDLDKNGGPFGGRKFTKQELLELSFVPVPANPEAVVALRSMNDDRFSPENLEEMYPQVKDLEEKPVEEKPGEAVIEEAPVVETPKEEVIEEVEEKVVVVEETKEVKEEEVAETPVVETPVVETPVVETSKVEEVVQEVVEDEEKAVCPYKDLGTLPESENWDGPGEEAKATPKDLKLICAWYDSEKSDVKASYKLPHHKADGHKAVWRGVAAAMASLLGARGGVNIPDSDKKGVYNHLAKHYAQFDKPAPDFKMVEDQVLAKLDQELLVLALEREEKHTARLVKKAIVEQKYSSEKIIKALTALNIALSLYKKDSIKGGDK